MSSIQDTVLMLQNRSTVSSRRTATTSFLAWSKYYLGRPSHLRFSARLVRAISGPPGRKRSNTRCSTRPLDYFNLLTRGPSIRPVYGRSTARLRPAYLMRHGPFLARLVFANQKACY